MRVARSRSRVALPRVERTRPAPKSEAGRPLAEGPETAYYLVRVYSAGRRPDRFDAAKTLEGLLREFSAKMAKTYPTAVYRFESVMVPSDAVPETGISFKGSDESETSAPPAPRSRRGV